MKYLVTGVAGFIGSFVAKQLCSKGHIVVGLDNINDYYDPSLKYSRLKELESLEQFRFIKMDLIDRQGVSELFEIENFDKVIHLAAQAGVRYSLDNPMAYIDSNLVGMATILEGCRHHNIKHLAYASSSSVYGMNKQIPFSTSDNVDNPVSLYAATKKANELMAHTYSHLYHLPTTGLRFFTVYGPWGRPDMAVFKFTKSILAGKEIQVYNDGEMYRDFTYIDDIVGGILAIDESYVKANDSSYRIYNIGAGKPVKLMDFVESLQSKLGIKANIKFMPMQPGDVPTTYADTKALRNDAGYEATTSINDGLDRFIQWYKSYYQVK